MIDAKTKAMGNHLGIPIHDLGNCGCFDSGWDAAMKAAEKENLLVGDLLQHFDLRYSEANHPFLISDNGNAHTVVEILKEIKERLGLNK